LGVDEYLEEFSEKIGALPYWKWEQVVGKPVTAGMEWEAFRSVLLEIAQMPNITLHFNLSTPSKALVSELKDKNSYTSREFMLIKLAFWDKTTLYTKSGTIYKIYDKKKIK
jgi:hypothetical protein